MQKEAAIREPLILGHKTYHDITEDVCRPIEDKAPRMWYILFGIALIIGLYGVGCILYLLGTGVGVWGLRARTRQRESDVCQRRISGGRRDQREHVTCGDAR